jgi:kynureninase
VDPTDQRQALDLDAADPLAGFRGRFVVDDPDLVYLNGNSLGRLPVQVAERLRELVTSDWGGGLARSWERWGDLPTQVGDRLGAGVLDVADGQVVVCDTTTLNLYKCLHAASALAGPGPIVSDRNNFPTDRYVLSGVAAQTGRELVSIDSTSVGPSPEEVATACANGVAIASFSLVDFRSGALLDLSGITEVVHAAGGLVVWDLSHAAGVLPIPLDRCAVEFAVGCTYKYLNAGPGAPAFLYARRDLQSAARQPVWGWFSQRAQFAMADPYDPLPDIRRFLTGTPSILGLAAVDEAVGLVAEAGLEALRAKCVALTGYAMQLADAWLADVGVTVVTPADPDRRAAQVSLRHPRASWLRAELQARGVVVDARPPDILRLGLSPLTTSFAELRAGLDRLRAICVPAGG